MPIKHDTGLVAVTIGAAGFVCFSVHFFKVSVSGKIPLYMILGSALTFAITFSILELAYACGLDCLGGSSSSGRTAQPGGRISLSSLQMYNVIVGSFVMGLVFGLIFGSMDVEDDDKDFTKLSHDQVFGMVSGTAIGAFYGYKSRLLEHNREGEYETIQSNSDNL